MKPYLLITNDDGIFSPGLQAMVEAVTEFAEVLVAAPSRQQTSMSRSFPRSADQGIIESFVREIGGRSVTMYSVHGSPAYAVAHAVLELADRKPDLCLSGINYGENLGTTVTCSGTLGAALEANTHGIPAIAVSLEAPLEIQRYENYSAYNWKTAKKISQKAVRAVLRDGFPPETNLLNINVPLHVADSESYCITTLSSQNYFEYLAPQQRDISKSYELQCERRVDLETLEMGSDIYATYVQNKISITPMSFDMTVKAALDWVL